MPQRHECSDWIKDKREEIGPLLNGMTHAEAIVLLLCLLDSIADATGDRQQFWERIIDMICYSAFRDGPGPNDTIQ